MDSIIKRLNYNKGTDNAWRVAISPHDDYAYVGNLYPQTLNGIKAKTVILFGVAHKARNYDLEDRIIFDSFDAWSAPYGVVKISKLRAELNSNLPADYSLVHDEMQSVEHSLEALIPFLQYQNRELEIIPILVPYMSFDRMQEIAEIFADVLSGIMKKEKLIWGKDLAIVISTDAVHYGDKDWGGKNYAPYGTDEDGLLEVTNREMEIINTCLLGEVTPGKVEKFVGYTVQESDYKEYKWTWCGRYSVPFGLLTSYYLNKSIGNNVLKGSLVGYTNSIEHPTLEVEDLNMGTTAPANNRHFVGYAAVGYK
jgi:AmmeMemoRadiSam system protein B